MASVAKSAHIYSQLESRINLLFKRRYEEAEQFDWTSIADRIYAAWIDPETSALLHQFLANPKTKSYGQNILPTQNEIQVYFPKLGNRRISMSVKRTVPHTLTDGYLQIANDPCFADILAEVMVYAEKIEKVSVAHKELLVGFKAAWNSVGSVNRLTEVWPASIQLLEGVTTPNGLQVLNVLREKKVRAKKEIDVDIDSLNRSLLMAKIAQ